MDTELKQLRCPTGSCGKLLGKAKPGANVEIVCRSCKATLTFTVTEDGVQVQRDDRNQSRRRARPEELK